MRVSLIALVVCTTVAFAQDKENPVEEVKAKEMAESFVGDQGWELGKNSKGDAYVVIGQAGFDNKSQNYSLSRSNAFQLASLRAKNQLAVFLAAEISSRVKAEISNGGGGKKKEDGVDKSDVSPTDQEVVKKLAEAVKTDAKAKGVSTDQVMEGTEFKSASRTVARAEVVGATTSRVFQSTVGGRSGLACVVRFTKTSQQIAECAMGKGNSPELEKLPEVASWIKEQKKDELLNYFGVRVLKLPSNEACLVAFGQAVAKSKSESSLSIAEEKASAAADQELRMFVGEMVESERVQERGSSVKELSESGEEFADEETFRQKLSAEAKSLSMPGIQTKRTWDVSESTSGNQVVGVVRVWSSESADSANALRKQMEKVGGSQGGSGRRNIEAKSSPVDGGVKSAKPVNTMKKIEEP